MLSALDIFTLLTLIFVISFVEPRYRRGDDSEYTDGDPG
jgi:hypothetical protein